MTAAVEIFGQRKEKLESSSNVLVMLVSFIWSLIPLRIEMVGTWKGFLPWGEERAYFVPVGRVPFTQIELRLSQVRLEVPDILGILYALWSGPELYSLYVNFFAAGLPIPLYTEAICQTLIVYTLLFLWNRDGTKWRLVLLALFMGAAVYQLMQMQVFVWVKTEVGQEVVQGFVYMRETHLYGLGNDGIIFQAWFMFVLVYEFALQPAWYQFRGDKPDPKPADLPPLDVPDVSVDNADELDETGGEEDDKEEV